MRIMARRFTRSRIFVHLQRIPGVKGYLHFNTGKIPNPRKVTHTVPIHVLQSHTCVQMGCLMNFRQPAAGCAPPDNKCALLSPCVNERYPFVFSEPLHPGRRQRNDRMKSMLRDGGPEAEEDNCRCY